MGQGATAFVTGASQGIGRRIAETFTARGWNVALAARSDDIFDVSDEIGDGAKAVRTDVTEAASVRESLEETVEAFGSLDCLVNNAGVAGPTAPIEKIDESEWQRTLNVNLTGMFRTVKYAAPHLRKSQRGRIVNISSITGKKPLANRTPYVASKMAVLGLTRTLAVEFGPDGVTVNAVCPGPTRGARLDRAIEEQASATGRSPEQVTQDLFLSDAALGEIVEPGDIASTVAFLASEEAGHITAQDVNVDAGTIWY